MRSVALPHLDDTPHHPPATAALTVHVQDQLAEFRDRELGRDLGRCVRCGRSVRSEQNYLREHGSVAHVRCHGPQRSGPKARQR